MCGRLNRRRGHAKRALAGVGTHACSQAHAQDQCNAWCCTARAVARMHKHAHIHVSLHKHACECARKSQEVYGRSCSRCCALLFQTPQPAALAHAFPASSSTAKLIANRRLRAWGPEDVSNLALVKPCLRQNPGRIHPSATQTQAGAIRVIRTGPKPKAGLA